ncbi:RipA family octameric membrane protein [Streptomyces sp. BRA346]|uniref:RipA family octameric membrane protein n=1 Tax=Streptomyces sp. BRA346 TaxID=2878199 RepID=UPI004064B78E
MSDGIRDALWNVELGPSSYAADNEQYRQAVLEQYKLYVEMADRVSARRNLANTFFLSLNSAVVAVVAAVSGRALASASAWLLLAGLAIMLGQCVAWFVMVRSYRQLNAAKYAVIGALEERLPAFAYSRAEWGALRQGRDWRTYLPLTHVEQWVPVLFCFSYLLGFCALVL